MTNKLCPLPFKQLYIHSSGKVYPCGFLQNNIILGDVKNSSLEEVWNGQLMNQFRDLHISGKSKACEIEQSKHNCHLLHLDNNKIDTSKVSLERIDFMVDSSCNLKCIMCTNIFEEASGFLNENFWLDLEKNIFPKLKQIELIGGEPFILKNTFKAIEIGSRVNKDIEWRITTNAHFDWGNTIRSYLDKIKIDSLAVSIDSLSPENFSKVRVGGDLERVLKNVNHLIKYKHDREKIDQGFKLIINFVVQLENYNEVVDLIKYCREHKILFYPILLREPFNFSILSFPPEKIVRILNDYIECNFRLKDYMFFILILKISKSLPKNSLALIIEKLDKLKEIMAAERIDQINS